MLRRTHILTAVALLAGCVAPGYAYAMPDQPTSSSTAATAAQSYQDLRSPDARDASLAVETQVAQDLRSPDARDAARASASAPTQVAQDLRSPDARDAGRVSASAPTQVAQDLRSPDARDAGRVSAPSPQVVEIRQAPENGFDWGDAGIGAAGILATLSIATGLLMVGARRRRRGVQPAH